MLHECEPYQSELSCVCLSAYGGALSFEDTDSMASLLCS